MIATSLLPNYLVCYMPSWGISGLMCASHLSKKLFERVYDGEMIFEVRITFSIQTNVQHLYIEQSYPVCQKLLCYRHKSYYDKKFFLLISLYTILYDMNWHIALIMQMISQALQKIRIPIWVCNILNIIMKEFSYIFMGICKAI